MTAERAEISLGFDAPPERVFDLFAHPEELSRAVETGIRDLTRMPATAGTTWTAGSWPLRTYYRVTHYEPPHRIVKELRGRVVATVEDFFEPADRGTMVTRRFTIERLRAGGVESFVAAQRAFLARAKRHVEQQYEEGYGEAELAKGIESSFRFEPSSLVPRRRQLVVELQGQVPASPREVYDVVVVHVDRFWEWMVDRSDPGGQLDASPDWPAPGSYYNFRVRSKLPFYRWEEGSVRVVECNPPERALLREHQNLRFLKNVFLTDWRFAEIQSGTLLSAHYEITACNRVVDRWQIKDPEPMVDPLRVQVQNIIRLFQTHGGGLPGASP